ncbi:MFS transporter [Streptomyces inhibens]|uniref:MFS transporter n=1 Tax=Streptomyces inhibens TaxID=2293571 RepID=UPI001EE742FC|nr:MFS transporter [Streptomyces inhibens]UKY51677.1 MFS transporter [Streptomyces inhibens]
MPKDLSASPGAPYHRRWAALAALLAAEAMNLLDSTIMTVAAPVIHTDLGGPASDIQWFSAAYTLPFAVLLITGGRLGDIAGRKRVFRIGVAGFVLASLLCALAVSPAMLITARAVQGAAAALVIPQTIGLIRSMFTGDELARAMGSIGPVMGLSAVCGPVLGGVLTHADVLGSSWRSVFLVNLPLGLGVLAAAPLLREDRSARRPRLDLTGTALAVLGTGLLVHPLIESDRAGGSPRAWGTLAAGLLVMVVFGLHQRRRTRRGGSALVEAGLFRDRGFPAALAASVLFFAVVNGLMVVVVLQLQLGPHTDVRSAGLTLLPWSCAMAIASWIAGARLVPRSGSRVMFAGLAALLGGALAAIAVYATSPATAYPWPLPAALAACGLGQGLFAVPFFTTALGRVRPHETGSAAGLLNAAQQLGGTLGVALLGTIFLHATALGPPTGVTTLSGARSAFWAAVGLIVATGVAATFMRRPAAVAEPVSARSVSARPASAKGERLD